MVQVAEVVGVHETTVSRAVSGKYIQTPQGLFEMKYFFTAGIQTATGDGMSNTSVKEMIAEIFKKEDPTKPLSDQEVVKMLQDKEIVIARRTAAKYRTAPTISPFSPAFVSACRSSRSGRSSSLVFLSMRSMKRMP